MRFMPTLGGAMLLCFVGAWFSAPSMAQQPAKPADSKPICANCHEAQHDTILLTAHDRTEEKSAFEGFIDWVYPRWRDNPGMHIYHYAAYERSDLPEIRVHPRASDRRSATPR